MRDNNNYNENILHMEKKATNVFGLILLIIILISLLAGGGYFIYMNKDNIDWQSLLPWNKNNKNDDDLQRLDGSEESNLPSVNNSLSNNTLIVPSLTDKVIGDGRNYSAKVENLKADEYGYTFDVVLDSISDTYSINCEKVLIDGFDTSTNFTLTAEMGTKNKYNARINKTELDALNISNFNSLTFFWKINSTTVQNKLEDVTIFASQNIQARNERKGLIEIDKKGNTTISYYQTLADKDFIYIYFDIKNNNRLDSKNIAIKKLLINGELYDYEDFNIKVYQTSEKVIYLTIPREKVSRLESFTISFFVISEKDNTIDSAYITNEYTRTF